MQQNYKGSRNIATSNIMQVYIWVCVYCQVLRLTVDERCKWVLNS